MSQQASGQKARKTSSHLAATQEETAAYILDMCRTMAEMAQEQNLKLLAYLLGMAALEAAQVPTRLNLAEEREPAQSSGPGSAV